MLDEATDELLDRASERMRIDWEQSLIDLLSEWERITADQTTELEEQVREAVDTDNVELLSHLAVSLGSAVDLLFDYMKDIFERGENQVRQDAADQGVDLGNNEPDNRVRLALTVDVIDMLLTLATTIVQLLASGLCDAVAREILRLWGTDPDADSMASHVREFVAGLSDRALRDQLGGGLTQAMNRGRRSAMLTANPVAWYATERNDRSACRPCKEIDETRFSTQDAADAAYPAGGYTNCEGGVRCRGGVVPVWGT